MEHEVESDSNCNWCVRNDIQKFDKKTGRLGNQRKSEDYPNYSIIKIGKNTETTPGDLRKLAVT